MSEAVSKVTFKCQPELVEGDSEAGFGKLNLTVRFPGANADQREVLNTSSPGLSHRQHCCKSVNLPLVSTGSSSFYF